jgi:hypothetical protein
MIGSAYVIPWPTPLWFSEGAATVTSPSRASSA